MQNLAPITLYIIALLTTIRTICMTFGTIGLMGSIAIRALAYDSYMLNGKDPNHISKYIIVQRLTKKYFVIFGTMFIVAIFIPSHEVIMEIMASCL